MLTLDEVADIERRAQAWVDGLALAGEEDFDAAVEAQLLRLTQPPIAKRRATALALAEVGLTEADRTAVFKRRDTVSARIFYDRQKDWYYGREFRDVLERLIRLYQRWSASAAARAAAADFREKEDRLRQYEHDIGRSMFEMAMQMVDAPLHVVEFTSDDGKQVTLKPARWTLADLPRVAKAASELLRLSLGMAPGGRREVAVDWREQLPEGITPSQAEAAMESWARLLAAADQESAEEDDE